MPHGWSQIDPGKDVWWLSYDRACQSLRKVLPSVITSLEREGTERKESIGLAKIVKDYKFIASLYMMCNILPHLSKLSCMFQAQKVYLLQIRPLLEATKAKLLQLRDGMGRYKAELHVDGLFDTMLKDFNIRVPTDSKRSFDEKIKKLFINAITANLGKRFPHVALLEAFSIFDPTKLPPPDQMDGYGTEYLQTLVDHFACGPSPVIDEDEVMNAECERVFSTMNRIKTRLRSAMKNKTLNFLILILL